MLNQNQLDSLYHCLTLKGLESFEPFLKTFSHDQSIPILFNKGIEDRHYIYIRTHPNSKVLAVAHTDWVMYREPKMNYQKEIVCCPQLDDRLGVWLITNQLPWMIDPAMPYDILLTDLEEKGRTTAGSFIPPVGKKYNWMFEFDRKGSEVVMYGYKTPTLKKLCEKYGFEVGNGSFTDICALDTLNCAGFNIGTGYHNEHSERCHADLRETFDNVQRFLSMYHDNYNLKLKHNKESAQKKREDHDRWKRPTSTTRNSTTRGSNIGFHDSPHDSNKGSKGVISKNPFGRLNLAKDAESDAFREAIKDKKVRDTLISGMDKGVQKMTNHEWALYAKYIVPLTRRKRRRSLDQSKRVPIEPGLHTLLIDDSVIQEFQRNRDKVERKEWTEKQYQEWMNAEIKRQDELWEKQQETQNPLTAPFEEAGYYSGPEFDALWDKFAKDPVVLEEGLSFGEWYKEYQMRESDTELEPTDDDLLQLNVDQMTDEQIHQLIMDDPLFSSDEFPGGREAREEYASRSFKELT
jgi:hypothetical protein